MLEKVKGFVKEHEEDVAIVAGAALAGGMFAFGYFFGYRQAVRYGDIGLGACFAVKPELKPMLEEALQILDQNLSSK